MTSSTLIITSAQAEDSGDYYCVAGSPRQVYNDVMSENASVFVLSKLSSVGQVKHTSRTLYPSLYTVTIQLV